MSNDTRWVNQLLNRYSRIAANKESQTEALLHALNTLQLADAVLDNAQLLESHPDQPLQIAVIGPTQSGKSTLVNVLLDADVAGISALAGFTVHAQGYASGCEEMQLERLDTVMHPQLRTPATQLNADVLDSYALESVKTGSQAVAGPVIVWDTPDFDSIEASTYTHAVVKTIALADIVVLMVSKDKYGDKSVWDMLSLIEPLHKPLMVCINKLDEHDSDIIEQAFLNRHRSQLPEQVVPPLVLLPFDRNKKSSTGSVFQPSVLASVFDVLEESEKKVQRSHYRVATEKFIDQHQASWFEPLLLEQNYRQHWQELIDEATLKADTTYAEEYLDNEAKYDTFNLAIAELLTLLEVPGIAPTLAKTRQVITWPARKLLGIGKSVLTGQGLSNADNSSDSGNQEAQALARIIDDTIISLQGELLEQSPSAFWSALNRSYRENESTIRSQFKEASEIARSEFQPHIEEAARKLYEQLQSQPALLNSLRVARATADAAGIALAVKSGGLAPADLLLAPAMLSVTTLLTESALGRYMETIKDDLRERQRQHMNERIIQGSLGSNLAALAANLDDQHLFAQNLEPELKRALQSASAL